jgi:hypothetical protein
MFHFRIDKIKIDRNRERDFPLFEKDLAELELWSFITTDDAIVPDELLLPDVTKLQTTTDLERKKELILKLSKAILKEKQEKLVTLSKIKDNAEIQCGFDLWRSPTIPDRFDWSFTVVEVDEDHRRTAEVIANLRSSQRFEKFADGLPALLIGAANPGLKAVTETTKLVADVFQTVLENSDTDEVGKIRQSFNRNQHFPKGRKKYKQVPDATNNMWVDFSMFTEEEESLN